MMLLFPAVRIVKSSLISNAISPSSSSSSSTSLCSTSEPRKVQSSSMVNFLVDSLGFSAQEATSPATHHKVKSFCETKANLVVNLLKCYGLDDSQIRDVVSSMPNILFCKPEILEPKFRVLQELGVSGSGLVKVLKSNRKFIAVGLRSQIIPGIAFFKELLGSNEKVVDAIISSRWLSSRDWKKISDNVMLLQNYGLSKEKIAALVTTSRNILHGEPEWFQDKLDYTEVHLGIPRDSPMFFHALRVVALNKSTVDKKIDVFKSFGWSDSEVYELIRRQPFCLCRSEADLRKRLNLFMKELKYPPAYLISYCSMFPASLEKRIKPRHEILKLLEEKKLVNGKPSLFSLVTYPDDRFLRFLERFVKEVPDLVEKYMTIMENAKKTK